MSAGKPEGRRESKTRETRERIFREAIALFERQGFADTKIRDIAARSGVSSVTVHSHFRTKDRLLHALAELYFQRAASLLDEVAEAAARQAFDPAELILSVREMVLAWPVTGRQLAADTQRVVLRTETGDRLYRELRQRISRLMKRLQDAHVVRSDLDADVIARATSDLVLGALTTWSTDLRDEQPPSHKAAELASFLILILREAPAK